MGLDDDWLTKTGLSYRLVCMNLDDIVERPSRHAIEDGVMEMTMGVQFFLTGVLLWFGNPLHHGPVWAKSPFSFFWLWIPACFISGRVIKLLKERVIAPRAGYVTPREEEVEIRITSKGIKVDSTTVVYIFVAGALVLWTVGLLALFPNRWFPPIPERSHWVAGCSIAVSLAALFTWIASRYKMPRYWWLAALSLAFGGWMYAKNGDPADSLLLMMTCLAAGWALGGAVRLIAFLKMNPRIEDRGE
jgi:hypothetical protein